MLVERRGVEHRLRGIVAEADRRGDVSAAFGVDEDRAARQEVRILQAFHQGVDRSPADVEAALKLSAITPSSSTVQGKGSSTTPKTSKDGRAIQLVNVRNY